MEKEKTKEELEKGCQKFVNEYDKKGNGSHFICRENLLCRDCKSKLLTMNVQGR